MKSIVDKITVPKWISCHTYLFGQEESRTYISNEKLHTYVQLDGITSDFWKLLYDKADCDTLSNFAQKHGIEEQIDDFINVLVEQQLLSYTDCKSKIECKNAPMSNDESDADLEQKFVEDMKKWLFEHKFLYSLFFELTYRCNLKCIHCYNPKHENDVEIDFELCKRAIDEAYDIGCFHITFSGGESLLHSRFYELVKYARSKHISVEIFTNGQVLAKDEGLYEKIVKLYPHRIGVSLYSTDGITHDKVTAVKGSFEKTNMLLQKMTSDNLNVQIKNFLLNCNCEDCVTVKNYAQKIGATSIADISLIPTIEGDKKTMQFALNEEQLFTLYTDPESPLYIDGDFKPLNIADIDSMSPCLGGFTGLCVTPSAEVVICVSLPYSVGNLKQDSIKSIWQSAMEKKKDSKLYQWLEVTISDCTECYKEDYCAFCNYCPGMGYLENGYLKHSDVQCTQAKVKMRAYNYLKSIKK